MLELLWLYEPSESTGSEPVTYRTRRFLFFTVYLHVDVHRLNELLLSSPPPCSNLNTSSPSAVRATIPDDVDAPASIADIAQPSRPPDLKGKSRASGEPHDDTFSAPLDVKGKSRANTPRLSPVLSNVPETSCVRSKKPIRTALNSLRAHLGATSASLSSSPNLLSQLSSGGESRKREDNSADMSLGDKLRVFRNVDLGYRCVRLI
ncbi:uncharacterized protein EV420DRAFT_1169699 [Desarmillaria tabescens]|uniref:Uncharacterized protein n=1 Tax=Armillaria tabescens TaxID=1929756 RepID=A0AA39JE61_ARMTA|nr:uncharacterized protein EV420DRAFT_1169699 [Desarmillaria tabescens]KAK0439689.1 hypothetical protein EV420DRAFT_1169699 [Desarmillaria tabescens]